MEIDVDNLTDAEVARHWRDNAMQLAAALRLAKANLHSDGLHVLVGATRHEITSGHIIIGALVTHEWLKGHEELMVD